MLSQSLLPLTAFRTLTHNTTNQLQIIISAMEQHEPRLALNACKKIKEIVDEIRLEILGVNDSETKRPTH